MKKFLDARAIVSYLTDQPKFKNLKKSYCYQKFLDALSPRLKKAIGFIYIKNRTLFIALSHPGFKMELNYQLDTFKYNMNMLKKYDNRCGEMGVDKVVIFNSNRVSIIKDNENIESSIPYYNEASTGEFKIIGSNSDLVAKFNSIKEKIRCNLN
ncbi:hypothetical protein MNB_SV-15-1362 [hydrothermal vent metagenome]|uniref:DUF721 domain-containing protein n=1 Tax=hydrothermal vent metagenome TaxID=652676 RepID=A0A1W1EI08_9ZZZZ